MNEIRQEIEVLLKQYEKQYKCSEEELRNIKEKRKRGRLILYVLNIAATLSCTISVVNMLDIIALQITSEQSNLSFTMISCAIVAALTICLLLLMEITKNHYRINNSVPKEWFPFYTNIKRIVKELDDPNARLCELDESPQHFDIRTETSGSYKTGIFGVVKIKSVVPFMTSIYGNGKPSSKTYDSAAVPLNSREDIETWNNIPHLTNVELPYAKLSLFTVDSIVQLSDGKGGKAWTYMVRRPENADEVRESFDMLCRTILYDIVRKCLKNKLLENGTVANNSKPFERMNTFSQLDLSPYFTKSDDRKDDEIQAVFDNIKENICISSDDDANITRAIPVFGAIEKIQ